MENVTETFKTAVKETKRNGSAWKIHKIITTSYTMEITTYMTANL